VGASTGFVLKFSGKARANDPNFPFGVGYLADNGADPSAPFLPNKQMYPNPMLHTYTKVKVTAVDVPPNVSVTVQLWNSTNNIPIGPAIPILNPAAGQVFTTTPFSQPLLEGILIDLQVTATGPPGTGPADAFLSAFVL
jgi:hypothetical protein